jgi:CyaY protein
MTDLEFLDQAERLLAGVEIICDRLNDNTDADVDNQRVGGMVTLTFPNRSQIVINLQKPLREVWLAAKAGGFHFKHDGKQWLDSKGQGEFFDLLTRFASAQAGSALTFSQQA